jgi:hypothetical protein
MGQPEAGRQWAVEFYHELLAFHRGSNGAEGLMCLTQNLLLNKITVLNV